MTWSCFILTILVSFAGLTICQGADQVVIIEVTTTMTMCSVGATHKGLFIKGSSIRLLWRPVKDWGTMSKYTKCYMWMEKKMAGVLVIFPLQKGIYNKLKNVWLNGMDEWQNLGVLDYRKHLCGCMIFFFFQNPPPPPSLMGCS